MQMTSLLGICQSTLLELELPDQRSRAVFVARFYTAANGIAALVQFVGLASVLRHCGLSRLMIFQPLTLLLLVANALLFPRLPAMAAAMLCFKVIEYSFWSATKDLVYMECSFDVRFIAKEFIDVFAYRAGKAMMAIF